MLINEKLLLNSRRSTAEDQVLILTGVKWEDYARLDGSEYSPYLISYLNHEIVIMSPGRNHERIADIIRDIITGYCRRYELPYFAFGSTRLKAEGKEGKEPDVAYAFATDKDLPDLVVEVNFTSGGIHDLTKYKYLKIKEVWLWQDREIRFYYLQGNQYLETKQSINLKGIKSSILIDYINRSLRESPLDIEREFFANFEQS